MVSLANAVVFHQSQRTLLPHLLKKKGYGYKIKLVEPAIKEARPLLLSEDIDITLEMWVENNLLWHSQAIGEKIITDLGEIHSGGKQYWIVSNWYAEKHNIETVFEMKR